MNTSEQRHRVRLAEMARRCGCRMSRPKPSDPVDRGAYRLTDLVHDRVLLGEEFDASLEEIETYLRRERNPKKTQEENRDNIVRQLAAKRGYTVRKPRARLYVKSVGGYQLFRKGDLTTPVVVIEGRNPTLKELDAFLRGQQTVGVHQRLYSSRPR